MDDWGPKPGTKYADLAIKFRSDMGEKSHPIITREKHPMQWRDWYAYYGYRRLLASQQMMREKDEKTVPTLSPFDFDATFNPGENSPEVPRAHVDANWHQPTAEAKQRVKNLMSGFLRPPRSA